jgi:hypothetical protein
MPGIRERWDRECLKFRNVLGMPGNVRVGKTRTVGMLICWELGRGGGEGMKI